VGHRSLFTSIIKRDLQVKKETCQSKKETYESEKDLCADGEIEQDAGKRRLQISFRVRKKTHEAKKTDTYTRDH